MRWLKALVLLLVVLLPPSAKAQSAITPSVTPAGAATLVLKATPGRLYNITATNLTATVAFLTVLNLTAAPADGAITPLLCVVLPISGTATIDLSWRPAAFNTGITAVITSANTCFTKTTGVVTGFISAQVE